MKNEFTEALVSVSKSEIIPTEHDLFGQFVGAWNFEWVMGLGTEHERREIGEWIFSWTLNGSAVQDVFIVPSRKENAINPKPDAEYGTTTRIYNPTTQAWDVFYGTTGEATRLKATKENDAIVLTEIVNGEMKWVFSEIKPDSFHWQHIKTKDNGLTWYTHIDIFATRRVGKTVDANAKEG